MQPQDLFTVHDDNGDAGHLPGFERLGDKRQHFTLIERLGWLGGHGG
jgi:hypothetical protein